MLAGKLDFWLKMKKSHPENTLTDTSPNIRKVFKNKTMVYSNNDKLTNVGHNFLNNYFLLYCIDLLKGTTVTIHPGHKL